MSGLQAALGTSQFHYMGQSDAALGQLRRPHRKSRSNLSNPSETQVKWRCDVKFGVIMDTSDIEYKRAFEAYIRFGTPIDLARKKKPPTTHYIWRTRGDGNGAPPHGLRREFEFCRM